MKKLSFFFLIIILTSCVSTKYKVGESQYNFDQIQAGNKYTFYDKNDRKFFLNVTSVEKDSIRGMRKKEGFAIAKNDIKEIKKKTKMEQQSH